MDDKRKGKKSRLRLSAPRKKQKNILLYNAQVTSTFYVKLGNMDHKRAVNVRSEIKNEVFLIKQEEESQSYYNETENADCEYPENEKFIKLEKALDCRDIPLESCLMIKPECYDEDKDCSDTQGSEFLSPMTNFSLENSLPLKTEPYDENASEGYTELLNTNDMCLTSEEIIKSEETAFDEENQAVLQAVSYGKEVVASCSAKQSSDDALLPKRDNIAKLKESSSYYSTEEEKLSGDFSHKNYKCDICQKTFSQRSSFIRHTQIHSDKNNFRCEICLKQFGRQDTLKAHLWAHKNPEDLQCKICQKQFTDKRHLRSHTKTSHMNQKHFQCEFCQKQFSHKSNFRDHVMAHMNPEDFQCSICHRQFTRKLHLKIIWQHTPIKRIYNVVFVKKGFHENPILKIIWQYTLVRKIFSATFVRSSLHEKNILEIIGWCIQIPKIFYVAFVKSSLQLGTI